MGARIEFGILGPLEVRLDGTSVRVGGPRQRALLALLLCHANRVVSRDRLIDELLGDHSASSADRMLGVQVSRLRKVLAVDSEEPRLTARPPGYLLRVEPGELDLDEFERLAHDGRAALERDDPAQAATLLRQAESLWRGRPLADLEFEPFAHVEVQRLEELRLTALEERIDAELALGRHAALCAELEALAAEHPLRERLRGQLMLALYRSDRQAHALSAYRAGRSLLVEELGLEPSRALRQLEQSILRQDPALALQSPDGAPSGVAERSPPAPRGGADRRRRSLAMGGLALVGFVLAGVVVALSLGGTSPPPTIAADSVGAISPESGAINADVPVGSSPSSIAFGAGALWASDYNAGTVSRIDPATHALVQTIQAGQTPSGIAVGAGAVWVADTWSGTVLRIDPGVDRVVQQTQVGNGPSGIAIGYGSVWVTNSSDGTLSRLDATTGSVLGAPIELGGNPTDVAAGLGAVWVSDEADGRVWRVDPQTDQVTEPVNVGNGPTAITVGYGSVWVTNSLDGTVSRIDPQTESVAQVIGVGQGANAIAAGSGAMWVANEFAGSVSRIDPATNHTRTIRVGNRPQGVAVGQGLVWVGGQAAETTHRGGTLTILKVGSLPLGGGNHESFGSFDPANAFPPLTLQLTNDGLTAFKRVGGSDGAQIVPDLAISLPTPTDGGLTYTFQLRRGIRYSNGQPVKPEDFRRAIERDFKIGDYTAPGFYANLVGGATCVAHPSRCDLSRGVVADDSAGTVTFHFSSPDPELLYQLALWDAVAVPAGIANHDVGQHPIPATGPYEVANVTSKELRLLRNPYFHEWSRAARPDGYPDEIVIKVGASPSADLTAVEHGAADYTLDPPPANRLTELETRFAGQLHVNPSGTMTPLWLNTRVAPFNDIRVRRALSYAIDRGKIARLIGSDAQPTCQLLTPYIPGYQRYCPYTLDPNAAGAWSAPDIATAQRLIAASHTRGTPITLWNFNVIDFGNSTWIPVGRYVVSLLRRLGYPAREGNSGSMPIFSDSRNKEQMALVGWTDAYPSASQYITAMVSCENFSPDSTSNLNPSEFCDPHLQHQIDGAQTAEEANSPAVSTLWAQADKTVTNDAPLVPLVITSTIDFVSRRVGNYQYSPQLGGTVLIDQLWVR